MYIIKSPLEILYGYSKKKGKEVYLKLNLNVYRNTHYRILNIVKIKYKELLQEQIKKLPVLNKVGLIYKVYMPTRRAYDVSNICTVHSKFFLDAFVEASKIQDDNYNFIPIEVNMFGGLDKENPRVDILIFDLDDIKDINNFKDIVSRRVDSGIKLYSD